MWRVREKAEGDTDSGGVWGCERSYHKACTGKTRYKIDKITRKKEKWKCRSGEERGAKREVGGVEERRNMEERPEKINDQELENRERKKCKFCRKAIRNRANCLTCKECKEHSHKAEKCSGKTKKEFIYTGERYTCDECKGKKAKNNYKRSDKEEEGRYKRMQKKKRQTPTK